MSPVVHAFPSLHPVPGAGVKTQPLVELQESVVQGFPSLQVRAPVPGWQVPEPLHASPTVQGLLSVQEVPAGAALVLQPPPKRHKSSVQGFPSSQFCVVPARQVPDPLQESPSVQGFPSSQEAPAVTGE